MILDIYFKRPLFWDYLIATTIVAVLTTCFKNNIILLPKTDDSLSLTGDMTNISLTLVGFILTILTVLVTFKDNSNAKNNKEDEPVFNKFFATDFYFETIKHLKNGIKSIALIAVIGFSFKLFLNNDFKAYLFFFNIFGLTIIMLTIYRCLLILGKILELQKTK